MVRVLPLDLWSAPPPPISISPNPLVITPLFKLPVVTSEESPVYEVVLIG